MQVESLMQGFDNTIGILEMRAESLGYCKGERLRNLGGHKVRLQRYRYLLVYRVKQDSVIAKGMYHELQDYKNMIRQYYK